jgi:hypothetical protein
VLPPVGRSAVSRVKGVFSAVAWVKAILENAFEIPHGLRKMKKNIRTDIL